MEPLNSQSAEDQGYPINLSPPASLNTPLWRSLLSNLKSRLIRERQEPLAITSKPVNVGMLVGDRMNLPWYRTVFSNIGDMISPETLPPLEIESQPVEVDELVSDQIQRGWWTSLLRNLADAASPERLPPLHLTSAPVRPKADSSQLQVPRWSSLITLPKSQGTAEFRIAPAAQPNMRAETLPQLSPIEGGPAAEVRPSPVHELTEKTRRALRIAHLREAAWISFAVLEAGFLLYWVFIRM